MCAPSTAGGAPKRQKRAPPSRAPAPSRDRIILDVGGTAFVASASTLCAHSSYLASLLLLSDDPDGRSDPCEGGPSLFLDKDPIAFGKLLAYMRRGSIDVADVDVDVLALAEFLGMEGLLLAAKVRWYYHIGRGPVCKEDEDVANAFDVRYGGVMNAASAGLFRHFLARDDVDAEREFAVLRVRSPGEGFGGGPPADDDDLDGTCFAVDEGVNTESPLLGIRCDSFVGALNGLFANGYAAHERQLDYGRRPGPTGWSELTFLRRKHSPLRYRKDGGATDVFVPTGEEAVRNRDDDYTKQFAMLVEVPRDPHDGEDEYQMRIFAPRDGLDPYASETVELNDDDRGWLQAHDFASREEGLEEALDRCLGLPRENRTRRIYSRRIPLLPREG